MPAASPGQRTDDHRAGDRARRATELGASENATGIVAVAQEMAEVRPQDRDQTESAAPSTLVADSFQRSHQSSIGATDTAAW